MHHFIITFSSSHIIYCFYISCIQNPRVIDMKMNEGDVCLADCATKHTILQDKRYFLNLTLTNVNYHIRYCKLS